MPAAILFDLGNTLARYYDLADFPALLTQAIAGAGESMAAAQPKRIEPDDLARRVARENHEAGDYRVRPLEERLRAIFEIDGNEEVLLDEACRGFMAPIFALGTVYHDTITALTELRSRGHRTALVSNTPWGSSSMLWREELVRLGLAELFDAVVFCRDAGWRKPAPAIFRRALEELGTDAESALFVGDDPRWDLAGPAAIGMRAVLIDRHGGASVHGAPTIHSLAELPGVLGT